MRTVVVGIGLIGGSIALDLRRTGIATHIIGVDKNDAHATRAKELGIVDEVMSLEEAMYNAHLVVTAVPVNAIKGVVKLVLDLALNHTVVIDTGSTKASICKAIENHPRRSSFVAAHPIAGTENSGPDAAFAGLFADKTNIICEPERSSANALEIADRVFEALKMKTIHMEPLEHDKHVAYVSHLSHVSSFLLGQTVLDIEADEKNIFNLAGSGFASTVRLAKSSPEMWAPIFEQNAEYLSQALLEYIMHLQKFQYYLMKRDVDELHRIMTDANRIRKVLEGIEHKQAPKKLSTEK
ncbi:MAG TPA: prephenate dehydrogenase [Chryseosolibacter sp.]|nr:prephenate dehydrogenase [Chryseosolibacter sp.]